MNSCVCAGELHSYLREFLGKLASIDVFVRINPEKNFLSCRAPFHDFVEQVFVKQFDLFWVGDFLDFLVVTIMLPSH